MLTVLARIEREGDAGLESACAEHPECADGIRDLIRELRRVQMGGDRASTDGRCGSQFGEFTLIEQIGSGGMGEVWLADQARLGRRVALKLIRPVHLMFARSRERFWREVQAASRLQHPNICQVFEAGEVDDVPFLAMRYVQGPSLAQRLARRGAVAFPPMAACALVEKVARALHAAHELGMVHRDVKPGNILLDADDEPVVVDFGLAHQADPGLATLTATGERVGTPQYMAPEQVAGDGEVDRRTDVYALGVTLYQCLTGQLPFESATSAELYRRILSDPAPDPRRQRRGISSEISVVLAKAMDKRPELRFATAEAFADELARIQRHEPIVTRRPGLPRRVLRWCQRNRTATGVLAASVIGAVVSLWFLRASLLAQAVTERALTDLEARAWLSASRELMEREPELAFRYGREALTRRPEDPEILAGVQEVMFRLRDCQEVRHHESRSLFPFCAPDGRHVVVLTAGEPPRIYRVGDDGSLRPVPVPDVKWRATHLVGELMQVEFSADGEEVALIQLDGKPRRVCRLQLGDAGVTALPELSWGASEDANVRVDYPADPRDRRMMVSLIDGTEIWDRDTGQRSWRLESRKEGFCLGGGFLADGRVVAGLRVCNADGSPQADLDLAGLEGFGCLSLQVHEEFSVGMFGFEILVSFDHAGRQLHRRRLSGYRLVTAPTDIELDARGSRLMLVYQDGWIRLFDARTLTDVKDWQTDAAAMIAQFSPDGRRILCCNHDQVLRIFDLEGSLLDSLAGMHAGNWSANGEAIFSCDQGLLRRWRLAPRPGVPALHGLGVPSLAVSPDGETVVVTSEPRGRLWVMDARGRIRGDHPFELATTGSGELPPAGREVHWARFTSDRELVVGCVEGDETRLVKLDAAGGVTSSTPLTRPRENMIIGFVPLNGGTDWLCMVAAQRVGSILYAPAQGKRRTLLDDVGSFELSADGRHLLAGTLDGLRLMRLGADGLDEVWRNDAAFPVCRYALARDLTFALVSPPREECFYYVPFNADDMVRLEGHQTSTVCLAISRDGRRLASGSQDGTVIVRDRATLRESIRLHHPRLLDMKFTASGQLVTAGRDGKVCWWWLDPEATRRAVEDIDLPALSVDERERARSKWKSPAGR